MLKVKIKKQFCGMFEVSWVNFYNVQGQYRDPKMMLEENIVYIIRNEKGELVSVNKKYCQSIMLNNETQNPATLEGVVDTVKVTK